MADIEPPSFCLGIDLDFEPSLKHSQQQLNSSDLNKTKNGEFEWQRVFNSDLDSPANSAPAYIPTGHIAAFEYQTSCSSSKFSSSGYRESKLHVKKRKQDSSCPPSSVASNKGIAVLQEWTSSPLKMFQLLDSESDSDDPSEGMCVSGSTRGAVRSKKNKQTEFYLAGSSKIVVGEKMHLQSCSSQKHDSQKDIYVDNSGAVPRPASDELCGGYSTGSMENKITRVSYEFFSSCMGSSISNAENLTQSEALGSPPLPCHCYFLHGDLRIKRLVHSRLPFFHHRSFCDKICEEFVEGGKDFMAARDFYELCSSGTGSIINNADNLMQTKGLESATFTCHRYFFHDDFRIQRLVHSQLPYFCPLSTSDETENQPHYADLINYRTQFCYGDDAKQKARRKLNVKKCFKKAGKHVSRR